MGTYGYRAGLIVLAMLSFVGCRQGDEQQLPNSSFTYTTSDSIRIPVNVAGRGYPCLFIPGGPGGGYRSFAQLGGRQLEKSLTMIWMDQRGSGSAQKAADYSLDRMLKDIDELRARLHISKMYLMCHSFGGVILVNYALNYPQHVKGLIFVNSTLHFFSPAALREQLTYAYALLGTDTTMRTSNRDSLLAGNMAVRQKLSQKGIAYKLLTNDRQTIVDLDKLDSLHPRTNDFAFAVLGPLLDSTRTKTYPAYFTDYTPLTARATAPTLVITGRQDHAVGTDHYRFFRFPNQKTVVLDGGHLLYHEQNEPFVQAVTDFVTHQKD